MIASTLRSFLEPLRDSKVADSQVRYLRNQFPFLGVKIPLLRKAVQELKKQHPSSDWRSEVEELWRQPEREFHHAALFWAIAYRKQALLKDLDLYERLLLTHSWWDTVDTIAPHLAGPFFLRFPERIAKTEEWLHSPHLWLKRAALIYPLHKRKEIDSERLFRYCNHLSKETDFFIRKAIGWVLREHSKTDPTAVRQFLQIATLSPLSVREAQKYLFTER